MKLIITPPLAVQTSTGKTLELMPVAMKIGAPSSDTQLWTRFAPPGSHRFWIDAATAAKVQAYMSQHGTEALSEDAKTAYTLFGNALVECDPSVCGEID